MFSFQVSCVMALTTTATGLRIIFSLMNVSKHLQDAVRVWRVRPSLADREILVTYERRLSERRVFRATRSSEVFEACVGSLLDVRRFTDETLAQVTHPGARSVLGALLDDVRKFLDRWEGVHTPRDDERRHAFQRGDDPHAEFFKDLGALRERVTMWRRWLAEIEPSVKMPGTDGEAEDHDVR